MKRRGGGWVRKDEDGLDYTEFAGGEWQRKEKKKQLVSLLRLHVSQSLGGLINQVGTLISLSDAARVDGLAQQGKRE